jgi:polyhydroxybutyrate depolymerase
VRSTLTASSLVSLALVASVSACLPGRTATNRGDVPVQGLGDYDPVTFGGARPMKLYVPTAFDGTPAPLVLLLHGYAIDGATEEAYLHLEAVAEAKTVLYGHPDGTLDTIGHRFWNATNACCDFDEIHVDDSAYIASLIVEISARYAVDSARIYLIGHSNGAFMAHRMACDHADAIAAIVSIAGSTWLDTSMCSPSAAVSVLDVHGTADSVIEYGGGSTRGGGSGGPGNGTYPGEPVTVGGWAGFNGCSTTSETLPPIDVDVTIPGPETSVTRYAGCGGGSEVRLWTIEHGLHEPAFGPDVASNMVDFLLAHGR